MKYKILFCFLLFSIDLKAEDSVKMTDFEDVSIYANVLTSIAKAVSDQNIENYSKCFLNFDKKDRKKVALFFIEHDPSAEIIEHHVIEENEKDVEIAIRYTLYYDSKNKIDVQSIVFMKNINSEWKVSSEKIIKKTLSEKKPSLSDSECQLNAGCPGGNCQLNAMPLFQNPF